MAKLAAFHRETRKHAIGQYGAGPFDTMQFLDRATHVIRVGDPAADHRNVVTRRKPPSLSPEHAAQPASLWHSPLAHLRAPRIWREHPRTTDLILLGATLLWAFNFLAVKYALSHGFSPLAYAGPRYFVAGLLFMAIARRRGEVFIATRSDLRRFAAAGITGICLSQITFVYALQDATVSTVALLFGTAPLLVALFVRMTRTAHIGAAHWASATISAAGVALVIVGSTGRVGGNTVGMGLALLTAVLWAVYCVAAAPLTSSYGSLHANAIVILIGATPLLTAAAVQLSRENWDAVSPAAWLALAYSTLVAGVAANAIWFWAMHRVGVVRASLYTNLEPFFAVLMAVLILSERITALQLVGGALLVTSLVTVGQRTPPPPVE